MRSCCKLRAAKGGGGGGVPEGEYASLSHAPFSRPLRIPIQSVLGETAKKAQDQRGPIHAWWLITSFAATPRRRLSRHYLLLATCLRWTKPLSFNRGLSHLPPHPPRSFHRSLLSESPSSTLRGDQLCERVSDFVCVCVLPGPTQ
jgi:hypothetical protein